jgi:hypothetical protein
MLGYAQAGWKTLAEALRNAAFAYELADEESAAAIGNETSVPQAVVPRLANGDFGPTMLGDRPVLTEHHDLPVEFVTVEQAALELEQGDQGVSLTRFAREWQGYESALRNACDRFDRFREWEGDDIVGACKKVEDIFALQSDWLTSMALVCRQISQRAEGIVRAHKVAVDKHVPGGDFKADGVIQFKYKTFVELDAFMQAHWNDQTRQQWFKRFYTGVTKDSAEILEAYRQAVVSGGPIQPTAPPNVGKAADVVPKPMPPKPFVPSPDDYWQWEEDERKRKEQEELEKKQEKNLRPPPRPPDPKPEPEPGPTPDGSGSGMPMMPSTPSMPSMPSTPQAADPQLADALKDLKGQGAPKLSSGGGVKPASFGGAGVPGAPLQSWGDEGATAKAAAAGAGSGNLGRGVPGVGGATGGGMGGGGLPAGGAKDAGKGKRVQGEEDESLYTEERAWTEGVIGLRSAKDVPKP